MTLPYFRPNTIYCGDCKEVLAKFPDECVDLIYADPPFFSNKTYEIIWHDGYELRVFEDRWKGGINNYILWMRERVEQCHKVLKNTGSFYLHCDWHASHYLKVMFDEVFGEKNLLGEVIWSYGTPSGGRTAGKKPVKAHDTILSYTKKYGQHTYNIIYLPYSKKYVTERFVFIDEQGRKYRTRKRKSGKIERQYLDESKGVPLSTVWSDIKQLYGMHLVKRKQEE
ncbi:MAG: hypothetical protein H3Z49_00455 [archaeon]|nr:hypothetical protein [archaeon]